MTIAQKRPASPRLSNSFISSLKKQFPDLIPPTIALTIFLVLWQLFAWTPGATLPGPRHLDSHFLALL
jgi:bicarbonate transport system permease protein